MRPLKFYICLADLVDLYSGNDGQRYWQTPKVLYDPYPRVRGSPNKSGTYPSEMESIGIFGDETLR